MPYDAFVVDGTQLKVTITATPTLIQGVQSFSGPTGSKPEIEYTSISDTAAKFKAGKPDFGTISFQIAWDPAEAAHAHLLTSFNTAGSTDAWTITCSDVGAAAITFNAAVNGWSWSFDKDAVAMVDVSARLSGVATVTP
jgi:hypothetical protein